MRGDSVALACRDVGVMLFKMVQWEEVEIFRKIRIDVAAITLSPISDSYNGSVYNNKKNWSSD